MNRHQPSPYDNHDEIWLLLPWYVNNSLNADEYALVKNHLKVCLVCRNEFAAQKLLAGNLQRSALFEMSSQPSFENLMKRIMSDENGVPATQYVRQKPKPAVSALAQWLNPVFKALMAKPLAVVAAVLLVFLSLPPIIYRQNSTAANHQFHTVANPAPLNSYAKNDIQVIFDNTINPPQVNALLAPLHLRIIAGPSPAKIYTLRLESPEVSSPQLASVIARLRGDKRVLFAEPAIPETAGATQKAVP